MSSSFDPGRRAAVLGLASGLGLAASGTFAQTLPPSGPRNTGRRGPGPNYGGFFDVTQTAFDRQYEPEIFGCTVPIADIKSPDWQTANIYFEREFFSGKQRMWDGREIPVWGFADPLRSGSQRVPGPIIRVQENDLVHVVLHSKKGAHTIHHHGIEPTTMNDGVGHVSFEVESRYAYQWQPSQAGTFFYHCHVNTVLHFEMGLFGLLVVDPKPNPDGGIPVFAGGPVYDSETFWVFDDMDPRWHELSASSGLCGDDKGLNIFRPRYFLVSGTPTTPSTPVAPAAIKAASGSKLLIRLLNAAYSMVRVTIEGLTAETVAVDGHALDRPWNRPILRPPGKPITLYTAQRQDVIIDLAHPDNRKGTYKVHFEWQDWITRQRHNAADPKYQGYASTTITVS